MGPKIRLTTKIEKPSQVVVWDFFHQRYNTNSELIFLLRPLLLNELLNKLMFFFTMACGWSDSSGNRLNLPLWSHIFGKEKYNYDGYRDGWCV